MVWLVLANHEHRLAQANRNVNPFFKNFSREGNFFFPAPQRPLCRSQNASRASRITAAQTAA